MVSGRDPPRTRREAHENARDPGDINYNPWPVIGRGPIPTAFIGTVPEALVEEQPHLNVGDRINVSSRNHDYGRGGGKDQWRQADVDADPYSRRSHLRSSREKKHSQKSHHCQSYKIFSSHRTLLQPGTVVISCQPSRFYRFGIPQFLFWNLVHPQENLPLLPALFSPFLKLYAQPVLVRIHPAPILRALGGWNGLQGRMLMSPMFTVMREVVLVGDKNRASLDGQNGGQDINHSLQELDSHAIPSL